MIEQMKVELVDCMGTDLSVVNAARVSFDKTSEYIEDMLDRRDYKLIHYLAEHNHWTPFGHTSLTFRIKAPIFVARQLGKHQVGLVWNEVSRRYVDSDPTFYVPDSWRKRAENVKQGSMEEPVDNQATIEYSIWCNHTDSLSLYKHLLNEGVCPEQARMVLPQSMMTEWMWTGSLAAFARVCKLRLDPHTQKETADVAEQIANACLGKFPVSMSALLHYK